MTHTIRSVHKTPVSDRPAMFRFSDNKLNSSELSQACGELSIANEIIIIIALPGFVPSQA